MKGTMHKACSCFMCKRGAHTKTGQQIQNANERKLRRKSKRELRAVVKGETDGAIIAPISMPYTD